MLRLRSNLTMRKGYTLDNNKKTQTILSGYKISVSWLNNNIAKSIYKQKNILVPHAIKKPYLRSSLTIKKKYTFNVVWKV